MFISTQEQVAAPLCRSDTRYYRLRSPLLSGWLMFGRNHQLRSDPVSASKLPKTGLICLSCRLPGRRWREGLGGCDGGPLAPPHPLPLLARPQPTCLPNQSAPPGQGGSNFCRYVFVWHDKATSASRSVSWSVNVLLHQNCFWSSNYRKTTTKYNKVLWWVFLFLAGSVSKSRDRVKNSLAWTKYCQRCGELRGLWSTTFRRESTRGIRGDV